MNGTAVSAAVGALAIHEAVHLCLLAQICTAMATEALHGTRGSYASFIHAVARPHPGQVSKFPFKFRVTIDGTCVKFPFRLSVLRIFGIFSMAANLLSCTRMKSDWKPIVIR